MIKIIIADDSAFFRKVLQDVLEKSGKIKVLAAAKNGKEALEFIKTHKPDLAIFDVEMPVMTGLEALRRVMSESPLPVLMLSSLTMEGAAVTIKALEYGAIDFLCKPATGAQGLEEMTSDIVSKVETIHRRNAFKKPGALGAKAAPAGQSNDLLKSIPKKNVELVLIGSSTGGVQAGMKVIGGLPENMPPIAWVQHMPMHFTERFAERLNSITKMTVKEAKNGDVLQKGHCYLAPGGLQMQVLKSAAKGLYLKIGGTEKVSGFCPSCDVLFGSASQNIQARMLGVILTGMGNDGAAGLKRLHDKGAYVIGQDEASCVVYGMPREAFKAGAVDIQLDLEYITQGMKTACGI